MTMTYLEMAEKLIVISERLHTPRYWGPFFNFLGHLLAESFPDFGPQSSVTQRQDEGVCKNGYVYLYSVQTFYKYSVCLTSIVQESNVKPHIFLMFLFCYDIYSMYVYSLHIYTFYVYHVNVFMCTIQCMAPAQ